MSLTYSMTRAEIEQIGKSNSTNSNPAKIMNSFYLYTDPEELSIGRWLSNTGYWESWITSWFTNNIKPGFKCIDIGANYGYYTRIMEKLSGPEGKVYSIEANPELIDLIEKSIKDYPIENAAKIVLFPYAVTDKNGTATLKIPQKYIGGSSLVYYSHVLPSDIPSEEWNQDMEVKTVVLDELISEKIDLIKIDIEGSEPMAWRGMQDILDRTDVVVIELGSYSPVEFIDEIYSKYSVSKIDLDGTEKILSRIEFDNEKDLIMAVLRKNA